MQLVNLELGLAVGHIKFPGSSLLPAPPSRPPSPSRSFSAGHGARDARLAALNPAESEIKHSHIPARGIKIIESHL